MLGVSKDVSSQELKKAYRALALKYHPDKNPDNAAESEEKFKEVTEAYSVLADPDKRARYDRFGHDGVRMGNGFGGFDSSVFTDFSDILNDFFGFGDIFGGRSRRGGSRKERGADLKYELEIDIKEAAEGVETKIQFSRMEPCGKCDGSGAKEGTSASTCPTCNGSGQMQQRQGFFAVSTPCPQCSATGTIIKDKCSECEGTGLNEVEKTITVPIPAGIDSGMKIRLSGEGNHGRRGGPAGDLYVFVYIKEHELFEREGADLYCEIPITFPQATLGTSISIPTLNGNASLKIPGGTQSHSVFRLKGKGMPRMRRSGTGDLYVKVLVHTPNKLSSEEKKIIKKLDDIYSEDIDPKEPDFYKKVRKM